MEASGEGCRRLRFRCESCNKPEMARSNKGLASDMFVPEARLRGIALFFILCLDSDSEIQNVEWT